MGFKANARKHQKISGADKKKATSTKKEGVISCGIKSCDGFADKNMGGRSLSIDNAVETWGDSGYTERKGRVRVCKSCYKEWKKDNKADKDTY
jgi:hypothetical protein